jgi:hypothetical protein
MHNASPFRIHGCLSPAWKQAHSSRSCTLPIALRDSASAVATN